MIDRKKAHRERAKRGESIPLCACGKQLKGKLSRARGVCSVCYKRSPEAKAATLVRVRMLRKKAQPPGDTCNT